MADQDSDRLCVTCGKPGGACRWTDDVEACMRKQLRTMRAALHTVRAAILNENGLNEGVVIDTLWVGPGETVVDHIDAALQDDRPTSGTREPCVICQGNGARGVTEGGRMYVRDCIACGGTGGVDDA